MSSVPTILADHRPAILAAPADDLPRLVFADHIDDTGEPAAVAWAEFIRCECRASALPRVHPERNWCDCERCRLMRESVRLFDGHGFMWRHWIGGIHGQMHSEVTLFASTLGFWERGLPCAFEVAIRGYRVKEVPGIVGQVSRLAPVRSITVSLTRITGEPSCIARCTIAPRPVAVGEQAIDRRTGESQFTVKCEIVRPLYEFSTSHRTWVRSGRLQQSVSGAFRDLIRQWAAYERATQS